MASWRKKLARGVRRTFRKAKEGTEDALSEYGQEIAMGAAFTACSVPPSNPFVGAGCAAGVAAAWPAVEYAADETSKWTAKKGAKLYRDFRGEYMRKNKKKKLSKAEEKRLRAAFVEMMDMQVFFISGKPLSERKTRKYDNDAVALGTFLGPGAGV